MSIKTRYRYPQPATHADRPGRFRWWLGWVVCDNGELTESQIEELHERYGGRWMESAAESRIRDAKAAAAKRRRENTQ